MKIGIVCNLQSLIKIAPKHTKFHHLKAHVFVKYISTNLEVPTLPSLSYAPVLFISHLFP